jgi:sec-independent protein translocase protein TatC
MVRFAASSKHTVTRSVFAATFACFLGKMRLVTAGFLWRRFKYAVLIIFIVAAVLTPTPDPWNQTIFAAPMVGLYLVSIFIVWLVQPKHPKSTADSAVDE